MCEFGRRGHIYRFWELGESKWGMVFAHTIVIERPRAWRGLGRDLGHFEGVLDGTQKKAFAITRLTVGVSNDLQMARNLTGGLPVLYQGHLARLGSFRERLTPAHEKRQEGVRRCMWECRIAKRTTGKMLGCMRRTCMQIRCT